MFWTVKIIDVCIYIREVKNSCITRPQFFRFFFLFLHKVTELTSIFVIFLFPYIIRYSHLPKSHWPEFPFAQKITCMVTFIFCFGQMEFKWEIGLVASVNGIRGSGFGKWYSDKYNRANGNRNRNSGEWVRANGTRASVIFRAIEGGRGSDN